MIIVVLNTFLYSVFLLFLYAFYNPSVFVYVYNLFEWSDQYLIAPVKKALLIMDNKIYGNKNVLIVLDGKTQNISINQAVLKKEDPSMLIFEKIIIDNSYYYKRHMTIKKLLNQYGNKQELCKPCMFVSINHDGQDISSDIDTFFITSNYIFDHTFMKWFLKQFHNIKEVKNYRIEIVSNDSAIDIIQDNKSEKNNSIMLLDKNSYSIKTI